MSDVKHRTAGTIPVRPQQPRIYAGPDTDLPTGETAPVYWGIVLNIPPTALPVEVEVQARVAGDGRKHDHEGPCVALDTTNPQIDACLSVRLDGVPVAPEDLLAMVGGG